MRIRAFLFLLMTVMAAWCTGCGDGNSLEAKTQDKSRKNASLREMVEDLSGTAGRMDVPVLELTTQTITEELSITGELVPEKSAIVKPLMDGRVQFLRPLKVGDLVKKGDVVAKIDDRDIEDEIRQQERQIEISEERIRLNEERMVQKQRALEFDRKLQEKSFISKNELERSEMEMKQIEIELRQSLISLEQEKTRLGQSLRKREKVLVEAPLSGMVVLASHLTNESPSSNLINDEILSLDGTLVGPGTALFGILSQDGFQALCLVNGKDKARIAVGQRARATIISYRPIEVLGKVIRLSDLQDQKSHAYKVWVALDETDPSFASGLFVRANVALGQKESALVVDKEYVKEKDNKPFVQTVANGVVKDVFTSVGLDQGTVVELVSGVQLGDLIIASKETFAADQPVNPVRIDPQKPGSTADTAPKPGVTPAMVQ